MRAVGLSNCCHATTAQLLIAWCTIASAAQKRSQKTRYEQKWRRHPQHHAQTILVVGVLVYASRNHAVHTQRGRLHDQLQVKLRVHTASAQIYVALNVIARDQDVQAGQGLLVSYVCRSLKAPGI